MRIALLSSVVLSVALASPIALANDAPHPPPPVPPPLAISASPWLGISMDNGGDLGVRIENVMRGSPAERAGLRVGETLVGWELNALVEALREEPGTSVPLTVRDNTGVERHVTLVLRDLLP